MYRDHTKVIQIGDRKIGGGNPILIQSMTNTKTEDVEQTVAQILALEQAGCDIIRCAVPTMEAAKALKEIKKQIHIPLVADIHFDYRLAIAAMENGADKIKFPGVIIIIKPTHRVGFIICMKLVVTLFRCSAAIPARSAPKVATAPLCSNLSRAKKCRCPGRSWACRPIPNRASRPFLE